MGNNPNKDSKKMKNGGCSCGCIETNSSNHTDPFKYKKGSIIPIKKVQKKKKNPYNITGKGKRNY
tara:strand:+ start:3661 stop:3855 length:195 start_codon:yes stop_codon:yes gene_type:complete